MIKQLFIWEIPFPSIKPYKKWVIHFNKFGELYLLFFAATLATISTYISFTNGWILAYGDAESHINIAKKVVSSLTPGFAQLGGIWLPISHIVMIPLVFFDPLWRTGLAGAIVSGISYSIASLYLYKTSQLLTKNKLASCISVFVFACNLNIVYMQSTPMTELPLICFFILSSYYFIRYLLDKNTLVSILLAAFFAFMASLTRYDGWFLVIFEGFCLIIPILKKRIVLSKQIGIITLFSTLAGFGILCWLMWDWLILGDPLYFTNSIYSAKAQQLAWLAKGELPTYHNLLLSLAYYLYTSLANLGIIIFSIALIGIFAFLWDKSIQKRFSITLILLIPFIFNLASLFLGQDVIFIPGLTPSNFQWQLFNVRYGIQMIPTAAIFFGYIFTKFQTKGKLVLIALFFMQFVLICIGYSKIITLEDGIVGLSASKVPVDVEKFINKQYNGGLVLLDDYARTISITKSTIPMQNIIYVGNRPYWQESLKQPEKYATWIIMQKNDAVWNAVYANPVVKKELYKYFQKVYTSNVILIFKRNPNT